jgi:two-component system CheB/CheR fusion protein
MVKQSKGTVSANAGTHTKNTILKSGNNNKMDASVPVIAIGASAGGLEAIEQFLGSVRVNSKIAYVIIQHLDPTREDSMAELLGRMTALKVLQAKDHQEIMPDTVYIIPPNKAMSVFKGRLFLFEITEPRGQRFPIDFFMRSLSEDQQESSIGVILSGMGTDGTLGAQAIRDKSGINIVQSPDTAKFNGMPKSVIEAGLADFIASPNEMPQIILSHLKKFHFKTSKTVSDRKDKSSIEKVIILLRLRTGNDFSMYKRSTIYRRIERRMTVHKIEKIANYVRYLQENESELDILYKELFIGVTTFFRDPDQWELLKSNIIPDILSLKPPGHILRAWVVGCSTGEEAYSLAIIFKEALELIKPKANCSLQIFATDIDIEAIDKARRGNYPLNISNDVSDVRLDRFFVRAENTYRVNADIREMIVFAPQNVLMHPPFTKLDIITCRNLLIYLDSEIQKKLITLFHYSLNPGGYLMLGNSETTSGLIQLFARIQNKYRIFNRIKGIGQNEPIDFPTPFTQIDYAKKLPVKLKTQDNLQLSTDKILLRQYVPAAVLINSTGDILYINGRTGKFLEPAAGKANWNIYAMAREGLREVITSQLPKVIRQKNKIFEPNIRINSDGNTNLIDLSIEWIEKPDNIQGTILLVFNETVAKTVKEESIGTKSYLTGNKRLVQLEMELDRARKEQQAAVEEMQTSQEELTSSNEELQSTIEELQSTNEELTTSKEEMQSLNEELQTVNMELQSKVDELSHINNDMKNLLDSTNIATLFLDNMLNIRRYTTTVSGIVNLIPGDIGRPISDLASNLKYTGLVSDSNEVLRSLVSSEKEVSTIDGKWYNVKIMPYRTTESKIDGVVITFNDITRPKRLEASYLRALSIINHMINKTSEIVFAISPQKKIIEFNHAAEKFFGKRRENILDRDFLKEVIPAGLQKETEVSLDNILRGKSYENLKWTVRDAKDNNVEVEWAATDFFDRAGTLRGLIIFSLDNSLKTDEKEQE